MSLSHPRAAFTKTALTFRSNVPMRYTIRVSTRKAVSKKSRHQSPTAYTFSGERMMFARDSLGCTTTILSRPTSTTRY